MLCTLAWPTVTDAILKTLTLKLTLNWIPLPLLLLLLSILWRTAVYRLVALVQHTRNVLICKFCGRPSPSDAFLSTNVPSSTPSARAKPRLKSWGVLWSPTLSVDNIRMQQLKITALKAVKTLLKSEASWRKLGVSWHPRHPMWLRLSQRRMTSEHSVTNIIYRSVVTLFSWRAKHTFIDSCCTCRIPLYGDSTILCCTKWHRVTYQWRSKSIPTTL